MQFSQILEEPWHDKNCEGHKVGHFNEVKKINNKIAETKLFIFILLKGLKIFIF